MTPLEHIGALYVENQRLLAEYQKLLALLQQTKDGGVRLDQITVDTVALKWSVDLTGEELGKSLPFKRDSDT